MIRKGALSPVRPIAAVIIVCAILVGGYALWLRKSFGIRQKMALGDEAALRMLLPDSAIHEFTVEQVYVRPACLQDQGEALYVINTNAPNLRAAMQSCGWEYYSGRTAELPMPVATGVVNQIWLDHFLGGLNVCVDYYELQMDVLKPGARGIIDHTTVKALAVVNAASSPTLKLAIVTDPMLCEDGVRVSARTDSRTRVR